MNTVRPPGGLWKRGERGTENGSDTSVLPQMVAEMGLEIVGWTPQLRGGLTRLKSRWYLIPRRATTATSSNVNAPSPPPPSANAKGARKSLTEEKPSGSSLGGAGITLA